MKIKKKIGLFGATAIVSANMMGSGIALLPSSLAHIGSITIISWGITLIGALSLAFVFAKLGIKDPEQGGPIVYARKLSPILGFQTGLLYWTANWIGNLAIAITAVEYLSIFYPSLTNPIVGGMAAIACIWLFTVINFFGADKISKIVSVTLILLLIPIIGTAIFGWPYFTKAQFMSNWNVSSHSGTNAVFSGIVLTIWAFVGVESASVNAKLVKNPRLTIPLATMIGTVIAAIAYISSSTAVAGMYPASVIAESGAPFAIAFGTIVGDWVKPYVSAFTAIACLAALASWMMLVGQAGIAAAKDKVLPAIFGKTNEKSGVPVAGLILNSLLMTSLMIVIMISSYVAKRSATVIFSEIISIAVLLTSLPYFYSSVELIKSEGLHTKSLLQFIIVLMASGLSFVALAGAHRIELIGVVIISLICFLLYAIKHPTFHKEKV